MVVSPMCQYSAKDGVAGDWHRQHYGALAASGAGQIVLEATGVKPEGRISAKCLGLWNDTQEAALTDLVKTLRSFGGSKLSIQLNHAGRKGSSTAPWEGSVPAKEGAWTCSAPSSVPYDQGWPVPTALDKSGIDRVKEAFVESAKRAARVGFDTVELHCAHGYLLHEFLSPVVNHRTDQYGGSLANRMRLPLETVAAVRAVWPAEKPLGMRLSAFEWVDTCFNLEESVVFATEAKKLGLDYICISTGGNVPRAKIPLAPGFQVPFAQTIRERTGLVVRSVGLIVTPEHAESIVQQEQADLVALARGFLNNPRWVWHAAKRLGVSVSYPLPYLACQPNFWPMSDTANPSKPAV